MKPPWVGANLSEGVLLQLLHQLDGFVASNGAFRHMESIAHCLSMARRYLDNELRNLEACAGYLAHALMLSYARAIQDDAYNEPENRYKLEWADARALAHEALAKAIIPDPKKALTNASTVLASLGEGRKTWDTEK